MLLSLTLQRKSNFGQKWVEMDEHDQSSKIRPGSDLAAVPLPSLEHLLLLICICPLPGVSRSIQEAVGRGAPLYLGAESTLPCLHQPKDAGNEKTQVQSEPGPTCGFAVCKTFCSEGSSANTPCDAAEDWSSVRGCSRHSLKPPQPAKAQQC